MGLGGGGMTQRTFNPVAWLLDAAWRRQVAETKEISVIGQGDGLAELYADGVASREDGNNFRTNQVTLAHYQDNYRVNEAAVLGLATAWACVNLLSGTISSLPLEVLQPDGKGKASAQDHPLYWLLHDSPNSDQTALDWLDFICACIEMNGNAYSEIARRNDGTPIALRVPFAPGNVKVERLANGRLSYEVKENNRTRTLAQENMLHIRGFGGSPLGGLSTLSFGRLVFGAALTLEGAARRTFHHGIRTNGAFVSEHPLNKVQMEEAEGIIQEKYAGAMNDGRPLLLNHGMKFQSIMMNPDDAQMLESRGFSVEEICRFFGVPPHMIGHTIKSTSWGTGLEQQTLGFQKFTLRRRLKRIEMALEKQLFLPGDRAKGLKIEFNLDGLLRGDSKSRAASYQSGLQNGYYTINEVRAWEGLPPIPGGDVPRIQTQNAPITADPDPDEEDREPPEDKDDAA